jgi:hypothetical protein
MAATNKTCCLSRITLISLCNESIENMLIILLLDFILRHISFTTKDVSCSPFYFVIVSHPKN